MTINDLIEFCETGANHYNHTGPTAEKFVAIAAALHAGQAMRDKPGSAKAMYEWDQATGSKHVD